MSPFTNLYSSTFKQLFILMIFLTCFLLGLQNPALAMNNFFIGARGQGMAGANVACVNDETAQHYNPAAFGFFGKKQQPWELDTTYDNYDLSRKNWGFTIFDAGAGAKVTGDLPNYVDTLDKMIDTFGEGEGGGLTIDNKEDVKVLTGFVPALQGISDPKNGLQFDLNAGTAVRVKNYAIGARMFFNGGAWVNADTDFTYDLGYTVDPGDLSEKIENAEGYEDIPQGYEPQYITGNTRNDLSGLSDDAVQKLDYAANEQGLSQSEVDRAAKELNSTMQDGTIDFNQVVGNNATDDIPEAYSTQQNGGDALEDNNSTLFLRSFGVAELPISYGHTVSEHWSVGGNFKLMQGRVYAEALPVFEKNATEDFGDKFTEAYKETTNFGIDLGINGRYQMFNVGIIARNLNSPSFDGPTVNGTKIDDVTLDPQFRMGVAFIPWNNLTIELDYDLNSYDSVIENYEEQNIALGAEWDIYKILALRLGAYKNLAEDEVGTVYTGGIGLNFWLCRLDIAAAASADTLTLEDNDDLDMPLYDNGEAPKEARVNAKLSVDF